MALACGHSRKADARPKAEMVAEGVCPVCPGEELTAGASPGGTVAFGRCSCCGEAWTLRDGVVRTWVQF